MSASIQKKAFLAYEADAWFTRNSAYIANYNAANDVVIRLLKEYGVSSPNVLEIGCSAGYRLNGIINELPGSVVSGIEPSAKAIEYGKAHYPAVRLINGTADDLSSFGDGTMDVVIAGFMFYVVDRESLFSVVAEIDRVLKNGALLVIVDFFAERPLRNPYGYISEAQAFSYKQSYDEIFTSSALYYLLDKRTYHHATRQHDATDDYYNKFTVSLLKKDLSASYR